MIKHYILFTNQNQLRIEWYIRSLLFLSWLKGRTITITLIDEGSTDETLEIVQKLSLQCKADIQILQSLQDLRADQGGQSPHDLRTSQDGQSLKVHQASQDGQSRRDPRTSQDDRSHQDLQASLDGQSSLQDLQASQSHALYHELLSRENTILIRLNNRDDLQDIPLT